MTISRKRKSSNPKISPNLWINCQYFASLLFTLDTRLYTSLCSAMPPWSVSTAMIWRSPSRKGFWLGASLLEPCLGHFYRFTLSPWPAEGTFLFMLETSFLFFAYFPSLYKEPFKFNRSSQSLSVGRYKELWWVYLWHLFQLILEN